MIPKKREKKLTYAEEMQRMDRELNKHLDKKYGTIVFRQKAFEGGGFDHPEDRWYLEADLSFYWQKDLGKGIEEFKVERRDTEDGEVFKDEFFGIIIRREFEHWVEEQARPFFSECKVIADTTMTLYPNELTIRSTLEDMLRYKEQLSCFNINILVKEGEQTTKEFQEQAEAFAKEWEKQGIFTFVNVVYITPENYEKAGWQDNGKYRIGERITEYRKTVGE